MSPYSIDLPMGSHSFTWMNKQGTKFSKLDRFLIYEDVLNLFPDIQITALDRMCSLSSHINIKVLKPKIRLWLATLKSNETSRKKDTLKSLKTLDEKIEAGNASIEEHDLRINLLHEIDKLDKLSNLSSLSSHINIKVLKPKIRLWLATLRSNETSRKTDTLKSLKTLDEKIEAGNASIEEHDLRINLLHEIDKLDSFEAMDSIQKAHIKWDVEGDKNSKFFHGLINQKRRNNSINGIMHKGVWVTDPLRIKERYWDLLKADKLGFVSSFLTSSKMPLGSNSSFITHVANPIHINGFRPISFIGVHYKIIAKVLAIRLSKVVDKIVGREQTAFIANRQILDGPLILSEVIDWYKKRKKNMLLFKVDF
nr:RNA-directed DNA polymerase, eukaryota, reverse transcriptase zinc-binding domain protein [Tanacetum cinerariifolium]